MEKNKGYTLVEMVIVIAIMAILASLSIFSVGIIKDAKRSAAINTFDNQLSNCLVKTKAVSDKNVTDKELCMYIYKRTVGTKSNYCIKVGYEVTDGVQDITKKDASNLPIVVGASLSYATASADDTNWDAILPKEVTDIVYTDATSSTSIGLGKIIKFNKSNGTVEDGAGTYTFYKNDTKDNGGTAYATFYLDEKTGNHYIK